ncbi:MAG TPA: hypothetical protein PLZ51_26085, partial [Aggregatilineales bacterium]|nr:hypothetical protein [Aggregatilineales bacterium]
STEVPVVDAIITEIAPIITPVVTPPVIPVYGITASDITCYENDQAVAYATYTTNDGATLTSATATAGGISVSVANIINNVVTIDVNCSAFPDGYNVTVDGIDSLGRIVTTN